MRETPKIVSLGTALAALGLPVAAPPITQAADSERVQVVRPAHEGLREEVEISPPVDVDLMSFTVHQTSDGVRFPQHQSHSSHASHASSSTGGGGSWPDPPYVPLPDPPYVPLPDPPYVPLPDPPYVPPPSALPPSQTTSRAPAAAVDPKALACTRANSSVGVIDIASELVQVFGMSESDAVYMAQQALTAVSGGNHYCDGYLGDHQ
jgi:hypothetical protein